MSAPPPAEGTIVGDAFRIVRPLSAGGMGAVYVAEQLSTGKLRALKLMHHRLQGEPKLRERFAKEARVAASIESAHVVEVIGAGVEADSGTPWLAMELLDGEDLGAHLARCGALSPSRTLELLEQIGHALGEAHDAGIVHRDLKPENVFIAESKAAGQATTVKILDFGIAKLVAEAQTLATSAVGSPAWMAPEQAESSDSISPATDVWALGLLTFWMLTGSSYWRTAAQPNPSMHAFLKEVLFEALPTASKRAAEFDAAGRLPEGFDDWFDRCVHREPRARFRSARDLLEAFRALVSGAADPEQGDSDEPGVAAETVPVSTRAFISSGDIGPLDLPDGSAADHAAESEPDPEPAEAPASDSPPEPEPPLAAAEPPAAPALDGPPQPEPSNRSAEPPAERAPVRFRPWWLLILALLGGVAWWAWRSWAGPDRAAESRAAADPTAAQAGGAAADATGDDRDTASGAAAGGADSAGADGQGAAPSADGSAEAAAAPRPDRPSTGAAGSSAPTATASASADAGPAYPAFNRFLAENRVKQRVRFAARQCASREGPRTIPVTLVFGGNGRVKQVGIPREIRHKSTGICVSTHMRGALVPPFSGSDQTINTTVSLP